MSWDGRSDCVIGTIIQISRYDRDCYSSKTLISCPQDVWNSYVCSALSFGFVFQHFSHSFTVLTEHLPENRLCIGSCNNGTVSRTCSSAASLYRWSCDRRSIRTDQSRCTVIPLSAESFSTFIVSLDVLSTSSLVRDTWAPLCTLRDLPIISNSSSSCKFREVTAVVNMPLDKLFRRE